MANAINTQSEIDNRPNMGGQSGAAEQPTAQVAEKAKELATAVSEKSKELASAVAQAAGTMARDAAGTVAQRAGEVASTVGRKAEEATGAVGSRIESFGHTVRERGPHEGIMGTASSTVAQTLESSGRYLKEQGLEGIGEDLSAFIRRHPLPAVLVGIGIGFCMARFFRSHS
jgi:hypothetical protein